MYDLVSFALDMRLCCSSCCWCTTSGGAAVPALRSMDLTPHHSLSLSFSNPHHANSGKKHLIAFELYAKNNKSCTRKKQGVYTMPVGQFALAYVAQKQQDYALQGNNYGNFDSLDYLQCTQVYYNDVYVSIVL